MEAFNQRPSSSTRRATSTPSIWPPPAAGCAVYSDGVDHCQRAIDLAPDDIFPYIFMATNAAHRRRFDRRRARDARVRCPTRIPATGIFPVRTGAVRTGLRGCTRVVGADRRADLGPDQRRDLPAAAGRVRGPGPRRVHRQATWAHATEARVSLERARENSPVDPGRPRGSRLDLRATRAKRRLRSHPASAQWNCCRSRPTRWPATAYLVRLAKIYAWSNEPYAAVKTIEKALAMPGGSRCRPSISTPTGTRSEPIPRFQELLRIHDSPTERSNHSVPTMSACRRRLAGDVTSSMTAANAAP